MLLSKSKKIAPGSSQPVKRKAFEFDGTRLDYSAFPALKPSILKEREANNSARARPAFELEEQDIAPLPPLPVLAADAPPLRRVRSEQLGAGLAYLNRMTQVIQIGSWNSHLLPECLDMATNVYRVGTELEESPTGRVPWYEARVGTLKGLERLIEIRVKEETDPPHRLDLVPHPLSPSS